MNAITNGGDKGRVSKDELMKRPKIAMVDEVKSMIEESENRIDLRFAQIDQRFAQIDQRFAQIDQRLDTLTNKVSDVELRVSDKLRIQTMSIVGLVAVMFVSQIAMVVWVIDRLAGSA